MFSFVSSISSSACTGARGVPLAGRPLGCFAPANRSTPSFTRWELILTLSKHVGVGRRYLVSTLAAGNQAWIQPLVEWSRAQDVSCRRCYPAAFASCIEALCQLRLPSGLKRYDLL